MDSSSYTSVQAGQRSEGKLCSLGPVSPETLVWTPHALSASRPPRAGLGGSAPLDAAAAGSLRAFMVASSEDWASSGKGARRLAERPCLRVWVSFRRLNWLDMRLHQD